MIVFNMYDFDAMRDFIKQQPAIPSIRKLRLTLFDAYRYSEDYDKLYNLILMFQNVIII